MGEICRTARVERRREHKVVVWRLRKEGQAEDKTDYWTDTRGGRGDLWRVERDKIMEMAEDKVAWWRWEDEMAGGMEWEEKSLLVAGFSWRRASRGWDGNPPWIELSHGSLGTARSARSSPLIYWSLANGRIKQDRPEPSGANSCSGVNLSLPLSPWSPP